MTSDNCLTEQKPPSAMDGKTLNVEPSKSSKSDVNAQSEANQDNTRQIKEINGPRGLEPTRYGDWEVNGRCYDF